MFYICNFPIIWWLYSDVTLFPTVLANPMTQQDKMLSDLFLNVFVQYVLEKMIYSGSKLF